MPTTTTTATAATARGQRTRARLLDVSADLVAERGFHAVGIAEIGAAAGVTGSAIYRHFASKQDILVALLDTVVEDLLDGARAVTTGTADPRAALDGLVEAHVDFALRDRALIRVYAQEADHLPEPARHRLRRTQRAYADEWVRVLGRTHPDLSPATARAAVHAAFGLVNSVSDYRSELPDPELRAVLLAMTRAALG